MPWPITAYLDERSPILSPRSIAAYRWVLHDAERRMEKSLSDLTEADLLLLTRVWDFREPSLSCLRNFLKWNRHPLASKVPMGRPPGERRSLVWYSYAELEVLFSACRTPRERLILHLASILMLRRVELERLTVADFTPTYIRVLGKGSHGGKVRLIPYAASTRMILADYLTGAKGGKEPRMSEAPPGHMEGTVAVSGNLRRFATPTLLHLKKSALDLELKKIGKRVGMKPQYHALRRSGARMFVAAGSSIGKHPLQVLNELRGFLGHRDLSTTLRYIGWDLEATGETLAAIPDLETRSVVFESPMAGGVHGPAGISVQTRQRLPRYKRRKTP